MTLHCIVRVALSARQEGHPFHGKYSASCRLFFRDQLGEGGVYIPRFIFGSIRYSDSGIHLLTCWVISAD